MPDPNPRDEAPQEQPEQKPGEQAGTDPAQERGERIETGKAIARGGKTSGTVPGSQPQPPAKADQRG